MKKYMNSSGCNADFYQLPPASKLGSNTLNFGSPGDSDGKESAWDAEGQGLIPGLGRSPEGNGYPLQCSCLENPMNKEVWGLSCCLWAFSNFGERELLTSCSVQAS